MIDFGRLRAAYEKVRDELLAERTADGHWIGELSSSALSTATAVSALAMVRGVEGRKSKVEGQGWEGGDRGLGAESCGVGNAGRDHVAGHRTSNCDSTEYSVLSTQYSVQSTKHSAHGDTSAIQRAESQLAEVCLDGLIGRGVAWLVQQQNADGGLGDTDLSHSNIATTYLVVAALHLAGVAEQHGGLLARAQRYIEAKSGLAGLRERYGIDKTFVVPIMTNLALAGLVDWRQIDALPFELACVPQAWYRFVGMPVVSYAIPALVAIGQARFFHAPPRNPLTRLIRRLAVNRSLKVLRRMQPESGGYLEATPLTSFVVMSLAGQGSGFRVQGSGVQAQSPRPKVQSRFADEVIREGVKFLANSIRPDGSWPIDTNLATWNTTLSINALAGAGEDVAELLGKRCLDWLLSCQHTKPHPFTGADPGGFGWSDLSGAVPDADDTPGAMLAMNNWKASTRISLAEQQRIDNAQMQAANWLLSLRNRDYGWPTFCRGWGKLPFDRSGSDLTAHVLRALDIDSVNNVGNSFGERYDWTYYLRKHVHPDGSWSPLWFGNQDHPDEDNPVYGTARVLMAYRDLELMDSPEAQRGVAWLVANQNDDGGWGSGVWGKIQNSEFRMQNGKVMGDLNVIDAASFAGESGAKYSVLSTQYTVPGTHAELPMPPSPPIRNPQSEIRNLKSSLEETALAVEALLAALPLSPEARFPHASPATSHQPLATSISRGLAWLVARVEHNQHRQAAPIGFYFAKLWYYERLYPLIFTTAALGRACRQYAAPAAGSPAKTPRIT